MLDFDVRRGTEQAWAAGQEGSIVVVRRTMGKNNILFIRRSAEVKDGLSDQMLVAKGERTGAGQKL